MAGAGRHDLALRRRFRSASLNLGRPASVARLTTSTSGKPRASAARSTASHCVAEKDTFSRPPAYSDTLARRIGRAVCPEALSRLVSALVSLPLMLSVPTGRGVLSLRQRDKLAWCVCWAASRNVSTVTLRSSPKGSPPAHAVRRFSNALSLASRRVTSGNGPKPMS